MVSVQKYVWNISGVVLSCFLFLGWDRACVCRPGPIIYLGPQSKNLNSLFHLNHFLDSFRSFSVCRGRSSVVKNWFTSTQTRAFETFPPSSSSSSSSFFSAEANHFLLLRAVKTKKEKESQRAINLRHAFFSISNPWSNYWIDSLSLVLDRWRNPLYSE